VQVKEGENPIELAHTALPLLLASAGFEMEW
jgi:hypothetical protein